MSAPYRRFVVALLLVAPSAAAQQEQWPCPGNYRKSNFDASTGNSYNVRCSGSEILVNGFNAQAGTYWNTYIKANGDMHGVDAQLRFWTFTERTGAYFRSDGRSCFGKEPFRSCSGPPE